MCTIIYLWQGERHRGKVYPNHREAQDDLNKFRKDKWMAWIEPLNN